MAEQWGPTKPHPLSKMKTELVWEGKYDEYGNRREVEIAGADLPLQKVEAVDEPRQAAEGRGLLFDTKKAHQDDFRNMLLWGDNKLVMAALLKDFKGKIDLIYIDPPFDVGADFTMDVSLGEGKDALHKDQSLMESVAYRDTWGRGTDSYLHMISERLLVMKELLSAKGSIYVHVGKTVSHCVKCVCDEVFGAPLFVNDITWKRSHAHGDTGQGATHFGPVTESVLLYTRTEHPTWNAQYTDYTEEILDRDYKYVDEKTGERYRLMPCDGPGGGSKGNPFYEFLGVKGYWRYSKERMQELYDAGEIVLSSTGKSISRKRYLKDAKGTPVTDLWDDVNRISPTSIERVGYATQKPEALLERVINASSVEGDLVADFFCGSGTTAAVAERLGRRWIMADLGRFAIHTSRKRLIEVQRQLYAEGKPYRAFDVYNLGRYERQWWQKERLKGADEEHRRIVLAFYRAEPLTSASSPLLHGRKGPAFVYVDGIDSILTLEELKPVVEATQASGAKEVHCLAWEFEMELKRNAEALEHEYGIKVRLVRIPREVMEKNRRPGVDAVPFFEMATLSAKAMVRIEGGERIVDVELTHFLPSLSEVPSKELEALKERAVKSGFDFIDFWAVDFDHQDGQPFKHHWQDYRLRKDRSLKLASNCGYRYTDTKTHTICVKVIDVFGCDTSVLLEVPGANGKRGGKK